MLVLFRGLSRKTEAFDRAGRRFSRLLAWLAQSMDALEAMFVRQVAYHQGKVFFRARGCNGIYMIQPVRSGRKFGEDMDTGLCIRQIRKCLKSL